MKREADFTTLFRHWLKKYPMTGQSCTFEVKQTTKDYISFGCVKEHQLDALRASTSSLGFSYKISDQSQGAKPFDVLYYNLAYAYIVIKFPKFFCLIDVNDFNNEKEKSKRKSLTSLRAIEIAKKTITPLH